MIKNTFTSKRAGFTLVEILVVIAIIGVLAALLFAVFSRVREKGRSASCQNNLHQIALAMQQYVGDNDGAFPPIFSVENEGAANEKTTEWDGMLQPYIKSRAIFYCPTNKAESSWVYTGGNIAGYAYNNVDLNRLDKKAKIFSGQHESHFDALSDVVVNYDFPIWNGGGGSEMEMMEASCGPQPLIDLHSGGANFSYGDGHVKWLSSQQAGELFCDIDARQRAANGDQ